MRYRNGFTIIFIIIKTLVKTLVWNVRLENLGAEANCYQKVGRL